jgi:hypothetical protein
VLEFDVYFLKHGFELVSERDAIRPRKLILLDGAVGEWPKVGLTDSKLDEKNL